MATAAWREYQYETAALFTELGFDATVDEHLDGVRSGHDLDVVVRATQLGLPLFWIVECKRWQKRVNKLHVHGLRAIVDDVGADRGILISESGFQSGAHSAAKKSNITLTSLADLRANTEDDLAAVRLKDCRLRVTRLEHAASKLGHTKSTPYGTSTKFPRGVDNGDVLRLFGSLSLAKQALENAEVGRWPVAYAWATDGPHTIRAPNGKELLDGLTSLLNQLESQYGEWAALEAGEQARSNVLGPSLE